VEEIKLKMSFYPWFRIKRNAFEEKDEREMSYV